LANYTIIALIATMPTIMTRLSNIAAKEWMMMIIAQRKFE